VPFDLSPRVFIFRLGSGFDWRIFRKAASNASLETFTDFAIET
jgi:hypothetical protein